MQSEINYIPYTYRILCIPTNEYYYGVRYAKNCNPADLWIKYFTSSKAVHKLVKQYGKDSFTCEIRKTFDTAEAAIKWETRVNLYTIKFSNYLNKNNGHRFSNEASISGGKTSSIVVKGSVWWNNGKRNTRAHISPGPEWVRGYLRGVIRDEVQARVKGVKLHWWNNGTKDILAETCPGLAWQSGMISGKRFWWNNGVIQMMNDTCPGPEWVKGFCSSVKSALSQIATNRNK